MMRTDIDIEKAQKALLIALDQLDKNPTLDLYEIHFGDSRESGVYVSMKFSHYVIHYDIGGWKNTPIRAVEMKRKVVLDAYHTYLTREPRDPQDKP